MDRRGRDRMVVEYLCNQCLSTLSWRVRTQFMARCTLCDKVCQ